MPKDDQTSTSVDPNCAPGSKSLPLKRGDACLYCRKRRIRCSADKPSCQHCMGKRECVYDTGKPVSRVKMLEEKVRELEGILTGTGSGTTSATPASTADDNAQRRRSSGGGGGGDGEAARDSNAIPHPPLQHHSSSGISTSSSTSHASISAPLPQGTTSANGNAFSYLGNGEAFDISMIEEDTTGFGAASALDFQQFIPFGGFMAMGGGAGQPQIPQLASAPVQPSTMFDFSTLDPNYMSLVNSFETTFQSSAAPGAPLNGSNHGTAVNGGATDAGASGSRQVSYDDSGANAMFNSGAAGESTYNAQSTGLSPFINNDYGTVNDDTVPVSLSDLFNKQGSSTFNGSYGSNGVGASVTEPKNAFDDLLFSAAKNSQQMAEARAKVHPSMSAPGPVSGLGSVFPPAYVLDEAEEVAAMQNTSELGPGSGSGSASRSNSGFSPESINPGIAKYLNEDDTCTARDTSGQPGMGAPPSIFQDTIYEPGMEMVGGWFDANDLPRVARDHLLDLFFSGMRLFGQEFHVPRFFASLTLPVAKRPHPCLLYSMYLLASRISTSPAIRALEKHFYTISSRQLDDAISKGDRLFDATRAATILAVYKYSNARYHEGWMMVGLAARLGISCGLHQVPSSVYKPSPLPRDSTADLASIMRQRSYCIPPPADPIELGERIAAFWAIYLVERCGSISCQWPPSISDSDVTTPYPKPLHEYELGLVSDADDRSLSDIWDSSPVIQTLPHYSPSTDYILRIKALAILERSSKLMYLKPEPEFYQTLKDQSAAGSPAGPIDEYLFMQNINLALGIDLFAPTLAPQSGNSGGYPSPSNGSGSGSASKGSPGGGDMGWMRCARIRTPKAYEQVRIALLKIEADLPPERRTNWDVLDSTPSIWQNSPTGTGRIEVFSLHFTLGCAWMFLFDVFSFSAENISAVNVARRMAQTVRIMNLSTPSLGNDFDVFIAMTWSFISKILIREMKRLQRIGDTAGMTIIERDVDTVIGALKMFGSRYHIAGSQASRAEQFRKSTAEEMEFMEKEGFDDEAQGHWTVVDTVSNDFKA